MLSVILSFFTKTEFEEFEPRLKFETRLQYCWFYLKLYSMFQNFNRSLIETGFGGFETRLKFIKLGLSKNYKLSMCSNYKTMGFKQLKKGNVITVSNSHRSLIKSSNPISVFVSVHFAIIPGKLSPNLFRKISI